MSKTNNPFMGVEFGDEVGDTVTGFVGVVTGRCEYITGCAQVCAQPPVQENGSFVDAKWFDVDRLTVIKRRKAVVTVKTAGFGDPAPIK